MTKSKHCSLEKTQSFPAAASPLRLQGPGPRGAVLWGNLYFWGPAVGLLREQERMGTCCFHDTV